MIKYKYLLQYLSRFLEYMYLSFYISVNFYFTK